MYEHVIEKESKEENLDENVLQNSLQQIKRVYKIIDSSRRLAKINYNQSSYRCAYIYYFAYCHTFMIESDLSEFSKECKVKFQEMMLYSENFLNVCSLGGGPGSDLVGLLYARSKKNSYIGFTKKIKCTVVDKYRGWNVSLKHVRQCFLDHTGSVYRHLQIFNFNLIEANLLKPFENDVKKAIEEANIVTMVKFVSVITFLKSPVKELLKRTFILMKIGSFLLYVDNISIERYIMIDTIAKNCGLKFIWKRNSMINLPEEIPRFTNFALKTKPLNHTSIITAIWQKL